MNHPQSIRKLIKKFSELPTVGPKTAERFVFYLLQQNKNYLSDFSDAILNLKKDIKICRICSAVSQRDPCEICSNPKRDTSTICIVANTRDMLSIENTSEFTGVYHILGGTINAIKGTGPENLNIPTLIKRLKNTQEVIIALNPDIEGETTSMYILKKIKNHADEIKKDELKITKLARGLSTGSDLEYADQSTLSEALKYRNEMKI